MAFIDHRTSRHSLGLRGTLPLLKTRLDLWRTRRALGQLDRHLLDDIGVSAQEARREAEMTVWDVPDTWRNR